MISRKYEIAEAQGIYFFASVVGLSELKALEAIEFSKTLGVLLDNAFDEAAKSDAKKVTFDAYTDARDNIVITITNSTEGDVDINNIFNKDFSTRGEGRGQGLWEVSKILNKHDEYDLTFECKSRELTAKLKVSGDLYIRKE